MPVKNKIHNTQKAEDFRLKRAPEVGQRGGFPGRIFMVKKGQTFKKRAARPRFVLFLTGIPDMREPKLLRKRKIALVFHRKRHASEFCTLLLRASCCQ